MATVKQMIEFLQKYEPEREVVLHLWNGNKGESNFIALSQAVTPTANTTNLLVLIENKGCLIKPIRVSQ